MDLATIAGLVLALGFILAGIFLEGADPMSVLMAAPMVLVFGGTIGAGIASSTVKDVTHALRTLPGWLMYRKPDPTITAATDTATAASGNTAASVLSCTTAALASAIWLCRMSRAATMLPILAPTWALI